MRFNKTIILIIILIFLIFLLLFFQIFFNKTSTDRGSMEDARVFSITSVNFKDRLIGSNENIVLTFNKPINNDHLKMKLSPNTDIKVSYSPAFNSLIIKPTVVWKYDISYTLEVLKGSVSLDGNYLDKDYVFNFKTRPYSGI